MRWKCAAAVAMTFLLARLAPAAVIFSNFGTGPTHEQGVRWLLDPGTGIGAPFTAPTLSSLDQIRLAFGYADPVGGPADRFNFALTTASGSVPGAVLESWNNIAAPSASANLTTLLALNSIAHPTLNPGQTYFVTAELATPTGRGGWHPKLAAIADFGIASRPAAGSWLFFPSASKPALEVLGQIPEPASASTLGISALALLARRRR